jgi:intracellular multiplication protein IcmL
VSQLNSKRSQKKEKARQAEALYAEEVYCFDYLKRLRRVMVWLVFTTLLAIGAAWTAWTTRPEPQYFLVQDGKVLNNVPVKQPISNSAQVSSWVSEELRNIFSFDFVHYKEQLESHKTSFTRQGWDAFLLALQDSKFVQAIRENRQVVSATPTSAPRVVAEGELDGRYAWKIEQDFVFTFYAGPRTQNQSVTISTTIVRVPTYENPSGLGIHQLIQESKR